MKTCLLRHCGLFLPCVVLLQTTISGCGPGNKLGTAPVTGTVTYKGQPVDGATVSFIPDGDGRPATAITKAGGAYQLTTLDSEGAMPGPYSVLVRKTEMPIASQESVSMEEALKLNNRPPPPPKELLPAKYGDAAKSPLKFEVKQGQANKFEIQLTD
jgi:hypothetical protein